MNVASIQLFFDLFDCTVKIFPVLVISKNNNNGQIAASSYAEFLVNCNGLAG